MVFSLANGFEVQNLTKENESILRILDTDVEQAQADEFTYGYLIRASNENFAVSEFRFKRIQEQKFSLAEFLNEYSRNGIKALEKLFLHPIREQEFSLLTDKINYDKITLKKLYEKHIEFPRAKLLRLLH